MVASGAPAAGQAELTLSVGNRPVPLHAAAAEIPAMIEAANARHRLPGLAEELDPTIIDPAKAARFIAGLPGQPASIMARIAGHDLALDWAALGLGAATPTRAESFARGFRLEVDEITDGHVLAHTSVTADGALARSRAEAAKSALAAAEKATRAIESKPATGGDELSIARQRRSRIADAWRLNARAWLAASPGDRAARSSLAAADKAAHAYFMPAGVE